MATEVTDVPERERFEITVDGELAGFTQYARRPGLIAYLHTEIDPAFGGRGLGSELIAAAVAAARSEELEVLPFCQFVRGWFEKHSEELDLVPVVVSPGGGSFHHGLTWHGSAPNSSGSVARMALVSHFVPVETRFHETNIDVTYSRYRRRGDLSLDESFFPVVWDESGYRTSWLAELPALD